MPSQAHVGRPKLQGRRHWSGISILSKRSFRSFTSDFEADDERSSTDGSMSSQSGDSDLLPIGAPYYSGHDTRPTSRKELLGWYMYGFAAEVYVVCGIGKFGISLCNGVACSKSPLEQRLELAGCDDRE
ncbi:Autophagy protein 22 [Metarhizium acridum]|nr:Autophagy protein 22 [Metarhizium acridum]